jgi:hypothetical protein
MLKSAGFTEVHERDCTEEFARVARAWVEQWDRHRADLVSVFGEQAVQERQADRRIELRAIEDGVLSRSLFTAVHPGPVRRASPGDRRPQLQGLGTSRSGRPAPQQPGSRPAPQATGGDALPAG